jgi:FG-GAP repeat
MRWAIVWSMMVLMFGGESVWALCGVPPCVEQGSLPLDVRPLGSRHQPSMVGVGVALHHTTAAIGNMTNNTVSIYSVSSAKESTTLSPSKIARDALFGSSLSLHDRILAVGAPMDNHGTGQVYIYTNEGKTWRLATTLTAQDAKKGDFFGGTVHFINSTTLAIGAYLHDDDATDTGIVYIFQKNGNTFQQQATLKPQGLKHGSLFGSALSSNKNTLVVGAYGYEKNIPGAGAVFIYQSQGATWTQQQRLDNPSQQSFGQFGWSVALAHNTLLVGAPYDDKTDTLLGTTYLFHQKDGQFTLKHTLSAPHNHEGRFGASVRLDGTMGMVAMGAKGIVLYDLSSERPVLRSMMTLSFEDNGDDRLFAQSFSMADNAVLVGRSIVDGPSSMIQSLMVSWRKKAH